MSAERDNAFQMSASNIRFGAGCTREVGLDLRDMQLKRTLVIIDPALIDLPVGQTVLESMRSAGVGFDVYDGVVVEPTDVSFQRASTTATEGGYDSFVAVGGGSAIDTAKAANLYSTHPAEFFAYVNAPIGAGRPVPAPLKPLIAIPTTAGTGSETTGVAIFDYVEKRAKTGIAHRFLKPTLGIVDPENTRTMPAEVAAATGLDVLSHALESYTAIPFNTRPKPARPLERPAYQGSNPISDMWALRALEIVRDYLRRAFDDTSDDEARSQMMIAAAIAGIGFGNAGVHLPHGMSYPVAGMIRDYQPAGYNVDHPIAPHGISVILNTPAVARFTAPASPERHLRAAAALGADVRDAGPDDAAAVLADQVVQYLQDLRIPNGLSAIGYGNDDIPALVEGTLPQHRVTKLSPVEAGADELSRLFADSMTIW
ncbi:MAG: hydroxyacid-oxoacid transhydrogenase [Pirellulaceae bacterium]|jgi:hydroxyacid-oxoacid transhydrogenase|nr:hydroxyacid-oxoacid transhydrogenase [Pirellulaceae bacterium]